MFRRWYVAVCMALLLLIFLKCHLHIISHDIQSFPIACFLLHCTISATCSICHSASSHSLSRALAHSPAITFDRWLYCMCALIFSMNAICILALLILRIAAHHITSHRTALYLKVLNVRDEWIMHCMQSKWREERLGEGRLKTVNDDDGTQANSFIFHELSVQNIHQTVQWQMYKTSACMAFDPFGMECWDFVERTLHTATAAAIVVWRGLAPFVLSVNKLTSLLTCTWDVNVTSVYFVFEFFFLYSASPL